MADNFRQTPTDKIQAAIVPDAQKTWTDKQGDRLSGQADKLASHAERESRKSTTQKVIDTVTPGNSSHVGDGLRQDPHDTAHAALKPDAQKTGTEKLKDHIVGDADKAASHVEGNKSLGQKLKDFITPAHSSHTGDHSAHTGDSYRQDTSDKVAAAVKPDAAKTTTEAHGDHLAGRADDKVGSAVSHEDKTLGQKAKDALNPHSSA